MASTALPRNGNIEVRVSVLVLTYNEEVNLPGCLASIAWADDILVIDSFSTDRTVEIARGAGCRVVQRKFKDFADQRNFGIDHGDWRHDWILHLDADEHVPAALREEIVEVVSRGEKPAYRVASKMMFQGRWLRHAGLFPWYQVRLGRRDTLRFVQTGHGQRETVASEQVGTLREPLEHYSFGKGLHDWFEKHNRYSTAEARHELELARTGPGGLSAVLAARDAVGRKRALKRLFARLPFRPTIRFLYMYLWRRGFLDGRAGLTYCRLLAIYEYMIVLKLRERR